MKCQNCQEEVKNPYKLCDNCLTLVRKSNLKKHIERNLESAEYYKRYNYHQRIEMTDYNKYIEKADRYAKALVDKMVLTQTTE